MKQMNTKAMILMLALMLATPAFAQAVPVGAPPSSAELQLPGSAEPAPSVVAVKTTTTTPANGANTATGMPGDPCPNLKGAQENAPDDLSKVQQDIDRFTLCVQRAQLLERLNESAIKSTTAADAAMGLGMAGIGGMGAGGIPSMPPLPANALGGADVAPAPAGGAMAPGSDINAVGPDAAANAAAAAAEVAATVAAEAPEGQWQIREIFGSTGDMQARLLSPQGDEMKVKKGTKLPDSSVVLNVTPSGVSIRGKKGVQDLEWAKS